jgi:hypothetical protein
VFSHRRSVNGRSGLVLSPLLLGTVLVAVVGTIVLVALWFIDVTSPGASVRANLSVAVAFAGASWAAVFFAVCRDVILQRLDEVSEQITRSQAEIVAHITKMTTDLAVQAEERGVFRGLEIAERTGSPPHPGGKVVPHPRLTEAHDRPDRPRAQ